MTYDLVIRGGTVIDGSGAPRHDADVGIVGDRIAAIGRINERGAQEVDAEGHFVAPGFIDGHTHLDAQVFWDPLGTCSSWHGVTSVVMGNCGFTIAPCREDEKDLVFRSLERAEDIPRESLLAGVGSWDWETFPQYLDAVARIPKGVNYSGYIGHSALRTYVMGERAYEEEAGEADLEAMRREVEDALRAGAIGFSTSRLEMHQTADDRPVASLVAGWDEVAALVGVMNELDAGIFELAERFDPDGSPEAQDWFQRLRDLALSSRRPFTSACVSSRRAPLRYRSTLALIEEVTAVGGHMYGQVNPREVATLMSFRTTMPFDKLPAWRAIRSLSLDAQRAALTDPDRRHALVSEALDPAQYAAMRALALEVRAPDFETLQVIDHPMGPHRTVADVARERGTDPVTLMIDLGVESNFDQMFAQPNGNLDRDVVLEMLRHPGTVVAVSDAGAHLSQIVDASNPTYLLADWVRGAEEFTWEEGVRMLTGDPARVWSLHDRGLLREGLAADVVVFDPATIAPVMPTVAHDLPAGARRLQQRAEGIAATVVNGEVLYRDGVHTGALPGRLLRGSVGAAQH